MKAAASRSAHRATSLCASRAASRFEHPIIVSPHSLRKACVWQGDRARGLPYKRNRVPARLDETWFSETWLSDGSVWCGEEQP
ncbi:hypothetical protein GCM10008965_50410 [Methylorubrum aminovorans]|nr:hypothetical protein GCM10025880_46550 [Methylorubrum aminovorans]